MSFEGSVFVLFDSFKFFFFNIIIKMFTVSKGCYIKGLDCFYVC